MTIGLPSLAEFKDLWGVAIFLLGFQMAAFSWRLTREIEVGNRGERTWMPPAEILNLASLACNGIGVFVLPLTSLSFATAEFAVTSFGLSMILFAGYPFALAGHYDLLTRGGRTMAYFTKQERIAILVVVVVSVLFLLARRR